MANWQRSFFAIVVALLLGACATMGGKPETPRKVALDEVVGQLHAALQDINELKGWEPLEKRHSEAQSECTTEAASPVAMCAANAGLPASCACSVGTSCEAPISEVCTTQLQARAAFCDAHRKAVGAGVACRYAKALEVPKFRRAEVTLNVIKEEKKGGAVNVLLFSASGSRALATGQTINLTLVPPPPAPPTEGGDRRKNLQGVDLSLRTSLQEGVSAILLAMAKDKFAVSPGPELEPEEIPAVLQAKEFKVTAEIVRQSNGSIGIAWAHPSMALGIGGELAEALSSKNQIVLVFSQAE